MSYISTYTDIDLGLYESESVVVIQKQGDDETRYIRARIIDNDGKTVNLSDCMITFSMVTADNVGFLFSSRDKDSRVIVEDNRVVIRLNKKMLNDAGKAQAEIILTASDSTVSSTKFYIYVESCVDQEGAKATPEYKTLIDILEYGQEITDLPYYANISKSYAVGGTGTRTSEDTDNSKYYCQKSEGIKAELEPRIQELEGMYEKLDNTLEQTEAYANNASVSATNAMTSASDSEGFASASKGYADASKEYADSSSANADKAEGSASSANESATKANECLEGATTSASEALESAASATNSAIEAKSWAVGGTGTREDEDTDNAKYWAMKTMYPHIYSFDEKKVGVWVNNKPIYQRTYYVKNINTIESGYVRINQTISIPYDIEDVVFVDGKFDVLRTYTNPTQTIRRTYSILYASIGTDYQVNHSMRTGSGKSVYFGTTKTYSPTEYSFENLYITIQYTKTSSETVEEEQYE